MSSNANEVKDDANEINSAKAIFTRAREIGDPRERASYLDQACGHDAQTRAAVEQLLADKTDDPNPANEIMQGPIVPTLHTELYERRIAEGRGTVIGPYKLMEQIGEGGFGLVFVAEQHQPVRRKVALKLIKPGMDTRDVIARFEAERQALALMDHPNIAKVFDAGATDSGRPYFVMELVRGIPITEYCDHHHLTPRERLALFLSLCHAIQHAHQKGIIHRDVKPTNVLVTLHDGRPVVKVIDFGVAKALSQQLTERTIYTQFAQMIGTPLYMSPEQAEMSGLDIDTRSDIYSLGVLLYELLTGSTPFDRQRMKKAAAVEIRRILCEEDPPRPSTRLSQSGERLPSIAAQRNTEPAKLPKLVRGDLDWIVMKCLEKDRNRRYETANGLARDLQRYLDDEPVAARPPSAAYRFSKFARRNKVAMLLISAAALTLLLLLVGLAVSNRLIAAERNQKAAALEEAETQRQLIAAERNKKAAALEEAEAQRKRAQQNFVKARMAIQGIMGRAATGQGEWSQLTPALRRAFTQETVKFYQSLLQEGSDDPTLLYETAVGYRSLATLHNSMKEYEQGEKFVRQSIAMLEKLVAQHPDVIVNRHQLAYSNFVLGSNLYRGRKEIGEAKAALHKGISFYEQLLVEDRDDPNFLEITLLYRELMEIQRRERQIEERDQTARRLLVFAEQFPAQSPNKNLLLERTARLMAIHGRPKEAIDIFRRIVKLKPNDATAHFNLAFALAKDQQWAEAIAAYQELSRISPNYSLGKNNLAWSLLTSTDVQRRDPKQAVELASQAVQLAPSHGIYWNTLGVAHYRSGNWKAAIEALNKSLELRQGGDSTDWFFLAMAEWQLGNKDAARSWYEKAVERMEKHDPRNAELIRFRAEAAELLGTAQNDTTAKPASK